MMQRTRSPLRASPTSTESLQSVSPESVVSAPQLRSFDVAAEHRPVLSYLESSGGDMIVTPAVLNFRDIEPGVEYRLSVTVKNRLSRPQRVRALQPTPAISAPRPAVAGALPFTVHYAASNAAIAPGMSVTIDVVFAVPSSILKRRSPLNADAAAGEASSVALKSAVKAAAAEVPVDQEYHNVIVIKSEAGGEVRLEVNAYAPGPIIVLGDDNADALPFGTVCAGSILSRELVVRNDSMLRGALISAELVLPPKSVPLSMRVRPPKVLLSAAPEPGQLLGGKLSNSTRLRVLIDARKLATGSYRALLNLDLGPSSGHAKRVVDVTVDVVEPAVSLVVPDSNEAVGSRALSASTSSLKKANIGVVLSASEPLQMGILFPGQVQTIHAMVVNNGPKAVTFSLSSGKIARTVLKEYEGLSSTSRRTASDGVMSLRPGVNKFAEVVLGANLEADEEAHAAEAAAARTDDDFIVTPSVGKLPPYGSVPVTIVYKATDRRKPSAFQSKSSKAKVVPAARLQNGANSSPPNRRSESPLSFSESIDGDYERGTFGNTANTHSADDDDSISTSDDITGVLALACSELGQRMGVTLHARLVRPEAAVSTNIVDFGRMAYAAPRRSATLRLESKTEILPMVWRASKCTGFHVSPDHGVLHSQEDTVLTVTFKPTHLGPSHEVLCIIFEPVHSENMLPKDISEPLMPGLPEHSTNVAAANSKTILTLPIALTAFVVPAEDHETDRARLPDGSLDMSVAPAVVTQSDFRRTGDLSLSLRPALEGGPPTKAMGEGGIAGGNHPALAIAVSHGSFLNLTDAQPTGVVSSRRAIDAPGHGSHRNAEHSNTIPMRAVEATSKAMFLGPSEHIGANGENTVETVMALSSSFAAINRVGVISSTALLENTANRGLTLTDYPGDNAKYTFTVMRAHARQVHASRYNAFLLDQHAKRKRERSMAELTRQGLKVQWNDATSLGLNDGKLGLLPPRLHAPESKEPLWLVRSTKTDGAVTIRVNEARKKLNQDKVFASAFKLAPSTHAERIDAARKLSPDELAAVICGPPVIDIGETLLNHPFKKTWGVINGLSTPILVQLTLPADAIELCQTSPLSQLVPPNSHAGFVVTFLKKLSTAEKQGLDINFKAEVTYTINGIHSNRFTVLAKPIPARVVASKTLTQLFFTEDNHSPYVSDTVRLANNSVAPMAFRWVPQVIETARSRPMRPSSPNGGRSAVSRDNALSAVPCVIVEPDNGVIAPGTSEVFTFVYRPVHNAPHAVDFRLALEGGVLPSHASATVITAHGEAINCHFSPVDKMCDFGKFGVGLKRVVTVTLRNSGSTAGVFYVQHDSIPQYVKVSPMVARVESGESIDLTVTLAPNEEYILDPNFAALAITVRGGKPLLIPMSAVVIMPDVVIDGDFAFGGVVIGRVARRRITLTNHSDIHTELAIDFRAYAPHWRIKPPRPTGDDDAMSVGDQSILRYDFDGWEQPGVALAADGLANASEDVSDDDDDEVDEEDFADLLEDDEGLVRSLPDRFIVKLNPGATLMFDLVFKPTVGSPDEGSAFDFMLPVSLFTTVEVPLEGLRRRVSGRGLAPRIRIESPLIDFGSRSFALEPERRVPHYMPLKIFNTCPLGEPVSWYADTSNLAQYFPGQMGPTNVFDVSPHRGVIAPGRSQTIQLSFSPCMADRMFLNTVPLHLEDERSEEPNAVPYIELEVCGKGIPPQLSFDRREIILPPVPLGVTVRAVFQVINTGFDYLDLQVRIPANEITAAVGVPLTVSFPEGQVLSSAKSSLPVVVEFHALQAMAFTVTIELSDVATGKKWGMPVTGSADNCLFSNFGYMDANRSTPLYIECVPGEAPQLVPEEKSSADKAPKGGEVGSPGSPYRGDAGRRGKSFTAVKAEEVKAAAVAPKREKVTTKPPLEMSSRSARKETTKHIAPRTALNMEMPVMTAPSTDVYTAFGRAALPDDLSQAETNAGRSFRASLIAVASGKGKDHHSHHAAAVALADLRANAAADADALIRWLNVSGVLAKPIQRWPDDIVSENGRPIFELIELISGRLIPGRMRGVEESRLPNSRTRRAQAYFRQAQDVIVHLKALGAHVHSVRPEALLSQEAFLLARKYIPRGVLFGSLNYAAPMLDPVGGSKAKRAAEARLKAAFPAISCDAWTVLTLQVLKLFGLGRVNARALLITTPSIMLDPVNGALWSALRESETNIANEIKRQRVSVTAIKNGAVLSSGAVPLLQLPAAVAGDDRSSADARSVSGRTGASSIRERAPTYVDPESTEAIVEEKKKPRLRAGFEPSIDIDEQAAVVAAPSSRRSLKGAGSVSGGGSVAGGRQGSVAASRAGGGAAGGAASVAGSFVGTIIGTVTGGRHERFSKGPVIDPMSLKTVDGAVLAQAATIHEKIRNFLTPDHALVSSNVYSGSENLLLRWLAWHYNRMFQAMTLPAARARGIKVSSREAEPRRFVCFERDLADCSAFIHLILSHAPELGKPGRPLDHAAGSVHLGPGALTTTQARENAAAIMKALAELNVEPPFRAEDLCSAVAIDEDVSVSSAHSYDGEATITLMMNAIKASAATSHAPKRSDKDENTEGLFYDPPPELTTATLLKSDVTVTPAFPLFEDAFGTVRGTVAGSDLLRVRQRLPAPGSSDAGSKDSPLARDNVLVLLWFFNVLPPQVPRAVVDFKCALGVSTTKTIVLSNPTRRPIDYTVYIEQDAAGGARPNENIDEPARAPHPDNKGSETLREKLDHMLHDPLYEDKPPPPVWVVSSTRVRVNAESTARFPVTATPAFSLPSHAKIRFVASRRLGGLAPSIITFALRTVVTSRPPRSVFPVRSPTYEGTCFDIDVANPTMRDAHFHVFVIPLAPDAPHGQNIPASTISDLMAANPTTFAANNAAELNAAHVLANDVRLGLCRAPVVHAHMDLSNGSVGPESDRSVSEFLITGWRGKDETAQALAADAALKALPRAKKENNAVSSAPQLSTARLGVPTEVEQRAATIRLPSYLLPGFTIARRDVLAAHAAAQEAAAFENAVLMAKRAANNGLDPDEGPDFADIAKSEIMESGEEAFPAPVVVPPSALSPMEQQLVGRSRSAAGKPIPAPSVICRYTNVHLPARSNGKSHTKRLPLQFMAMMPGTHRAAVVLVDAQSAIAEMVFEITAVAEDPNVAAIMQARAPLAKVIEKCIKLPPVNAAFEDARDDLLLRLPDDARQLEVDSRAHDRRAESQARETALRLLRKSYRAAHPKKMNRPVGEGSMMWSKSDAGLGVHKSDSRSQLNTNAKIVATLVLGSMYKVYVDSPFFSAPKSVFVPAPLSTLPPVGAGTYGVRDEGSSIGGGVHDIDGGGSVLSRVNVATLIEPALTDLPGIDGVKPGASSIAAMAPSQAAIFKGSNAPVFFKPISAPLAVADALGESTPDSLRCLGQLPITLTPKGAGKYLTRVVLTSDRDTRVYEISITVDDPGPSKIIQMAAPLGKLVSQTFGVSNIPATGPRASQATNWTLQPVLRGVGRSSTDRAGNALPLHFTVSPDIISVPVHGVAVVTVEWCPIVEGDELAQLDLVPAEGFMSDAEMMTVPPLKYELHGIGEPPLALGTISLHTHLKGVAKASVHVTSPLIPGPASTSTTLRVKCSVPGVIIPHTIDVPAPGDGSSALEFEWIPPRAGSFSGTLTAEDSRTGRYVWWALNCVALAPEPVGRLAMTTKVRSAVAADIEIANPSTVDALVLDVSLSGEGLLGPAELVVPPGSMRILELLYAPFFPTDGTVAGQATLTPIKHEGGGADIVRGAEIVYALDLTADAADPIVVPPLTTPISGSIHSYLTLENSTSAAAIVRASVLEGLSTPRGVFSVDVTSAAVTGNVGDAKSTGDEREWHRAESDHGLLTIPAFTVVRVPVSFTPSSLAAPQTATVLFESSSLGEWRFQLSGTGSKPVPAEPRTFAAAMGETLSASIDFRNPFDFPAPVEVQLIVSAETAAEVSSLARDSSFGASLGSSAPILKLLLGHNGKTCSFVVPSRSTFSIPFAFVPPALILANAEMRVSVSPSESLNVRTPIMWTFPFRCIGEAPVSSEIVALRGVARRTATVNFSVPLPGLSIKLSGSPVTVSLAPSGSSAPEAEGRGGSTLLGGMGSIASAVSVHSKGHMGLRDSDDNGPSPHALALSAEELQRAVTIIPSRNVFGAPGEALQLTAQIHAMRPLTLAAELTIARPDGIGGRWRVPVRVSIAAAEPDDELVVSAAMHTTGSLSFSLTNVFPHPAPFTAEFAVDAPAELSVSPSSGVLPASTAAAVARGTGSDAPTSSKITVFFHPKDYSHQVKGLLTVKTDSFQWSFRVVGRIPDALPPDASRLVSTVDDHLSARTREALRASKVAKRRM